MMVFAGNATPDLAARIAERLELPLGKAKVARFSDGEVAVEINENVRGRDVFIVQSTCPPSNENLMELLVMVDALYRASAGRITTVIPYFGYARQDRRPRAARVPISAKLVANMLTSAGVDRVLTMDLHADQIQGFFDIPVDNVYASPVLLDDMRKLREEAASKGQELIMVSPDVGGADRARAFAKRLSDSDLAIIDKRRPRANESQVMNIIGDVDGKSCVIVDDLVDTAGTLCKAAGALKEKGAAQVKAYIAHPVLSGKAMDNINASVLDELVVTDTIPLHAEAAACDKIRQLGIAELMAETMRRISDEESVISLYAE
ncbi:ribose-phosphate pyrophosphokinase [Gammaproteobacteria bacterium AB-CW1]|uniref:Ribose-phosphate pyrophosphokinase n=1 Tax=Natronospira elongata TaxID=3110268 RepID=A0AAP6JI45_9GAMM|nr:ribose-phosphate pyrophosphokinase [Gammaproteobacteria bacterium AB-CW1]